MVPTSFWGFENTISLSSLRKWSFLASVSVGGKDWAPLTTRPCFMLVTPDLRSEDVSHLPKMLCDFYLSNQNYSKVIEKNQEEVLHTSYYISSPAFDK